MLPNRISFCMDFRGPSYNLDSACSSSLSALHEAYKSIKNGICDAAIVCASNLILGPNLSISFAEIGVLAIDGIDQPFDKDSDGYVRSEGIVVIFLQKRKDANRIYAEIVHTQISNEGYKPEGISHPNALRQQDLFTSFYTDINIDPRSVSYVEAHMTGTRVSIFLSDHSISTA